jgi:hypothetical protein
MKTNTVYTDRIYKNKAGEYFTGEYLYNHYQIKTEDASKHGYKDVKLYARDYAEYDRELTGKTIRCNYDQIFPAGAQMILCNEIPSAFPELWDYMENGDVYDEETDEYSEIYQFYIINNMTAERLKESTDEIIFYIEKLDLYVLGVTHWGTAWSHVGADFIY